MLEPTKALRNKLEKVLLLDENEALFFVSSLSIVKDYIIDLNTNDQLFKKGIRSDGTELPVYSTTSQDLYDKPNRPFTLYDTGDFYNTFIVIPTRQGYFIITADGEKEDKNLLVAYGEKIVGLTEESRDKLAIFIQQFTVDYIFKVLNS